MADQEKPANGDGISVEEDVARRLKPGPAFDPVNLMSQIFEDSSSFAGPAEDVLLSWLMRLSPDVNQQDAARKVLDDIAGSIAEDASDEARKLYDLLRQAAEGQGGAEAHKRRGGRSGRARQ